MLFTELPTTTIADASSSDEIASPPLTKSDAITIPVVKQRPSEAADTGEDVELGIDEPTTLAPTSTHKAATPQTLSLSMDNKASSSEAAATHLPPHDPAEATSGSSPVFVHVPSSSLIVAGREAGIATEAPLAYAPLPQPENTVTAERREESNRLSPKPDTESLPTDTMVKKDFVSSEKHPITAADVKSGVSTSNRTHVTSDTDPDLKIQPNQLYASWGSNLRNVSKAGVGSEDGHPVETILDGIIQALDTRVNQELPSEPRDTLVGKSKITDEQVAPSPQVSVKQPTSRREDENQEQAHPEPQSNPSFLAKENRKDDDENSFQLPPIPSGYISNLNPTNTEYLVHRNQHQHNNHANNHSGNKILTSYFNSEVNLKNSTAGSQTRPAPTYGNTVGRIQVSSKIGFSSSPDRLNIPHLPRPQTHLSNSGSFLVVGDDNDGKKAGTVEDEPLGTHVEIITAKTPFLEANISNSNSFLINLSPTTLQVGSAAASPPFYSPNEPVYESEKRGSVFPASPLAPHKPPPSFPTYFASNNNQWKIVTQNHSPKSKLPKSDEPDPADAYSPIGPELTRRSGFVMETSEEKQNEDEKYGEASELPPAVAYEPSNDALGQENASLLAESSHAIIGSATSPFLKRNGNMAIRGPITGTEAQWSEAMAVASAEQRSGECRQRKAH